MRLLAALLAALVLAAPASAQFNQLPAPSQTTETPTVTVAPPPANTSSDGGLKGWQETLLFVAGIILLLGIGWAIASDARKRAPVKDSELAHPGMGSAASRRNRSQKQKERERAKAMAGRKQRRRQGRR